MLTNSSDSLLLTRPLRDAPAFSRIMRNHHWRVLGCPTIQVIQHSETAGLDFLSGYYDWIIFNSRYSVQILFGELRKRNMLEYFLKAKKICAVGTETAKVIERYGVKVDLIPDVYAATGVIDSFRKYNISRQQILLTMGDRSDNWLMKQLDAMGNQCTPVTVYKNQVPQDLPEYVFTSIADKTISLLAVTAPSAIHNLFSFPELTPYHESLKSIPIVSIGPKTSAACRALGCNIAIESREHTLVGLAKSIVMGYGLTQH